MTISSHIYALRFDQRVTMYLCIYKLEHKGYIKWTNSIYVTRYPTYFLLYNVTLYVANNTTIKSGSFDSNLAQHEQWINSPIIKIAF